MNNFSGGNKFGGGNFKKNNFGGGNFRKPGFKSGGASFERKEMFTVTCSECGKDASVPFKPNGRKPVLCSDCFQKERGNENRSENRQESRSFNDRPSYGDRNERPSYGDRGNSYGDRPQRPEFKNNAVQQSMPGVNYKKDFESLNYKLDKILKLLSPNTQPETVPFVKEATPALEVPRKLVMPVSEPVESIEEELERLVAEVTEKAPAKKKATKAAPKAAKKAAVKAPAAAKKVSKAKKA